jgi:hypothetical protein
MLLLLLPATTSTVASSSKHMRGLGLLRGLSRWQHRLLCRWWAFQHTLLPARQQ